MSHRALASFGLLFLFVASCGRNQAPLASNTGHSDAQNNIENRHSQHLSTDHSHGDRHAAHVASLDHGHSSTGHGHDEHPSHQPHHPSADSSEHEHQAEDQADQPNATPESVDESTSSLKIFEKRILPIFQSAKPSSCAECHLSGVDLKEYIRPTQEATFGSLVSAGMIDLQKPDESKLLQFINRRPEKRNRLTDKSRKQEYQAFRAWIRAAAIDPNLLARKDSVEPIGPKFPEAVIRHARTDRVLASFIDNVWNEVGRCAACHSPDRNQQQVQENGEKVSWITLRDPQATLDYMRKAGLIDPDKPEQSLLLMKPTMQVKHGGGQKMVVGDRTYKQFRRFIDDYANIVQGKYQQTDQLPEQDSEVSVVSDIWMKIDDVPADYDKLLMQVDVYRRGERGWSHDRVATSDRQVFGAGKLWQHSLSLTAPRASAAADEIRTERLPPGKYLLKLYVDRSGKLQKDFTALMNDQDFVGQIEVQTDWPSGYGQMTTVKFPKD